MRILLSVAVSLGLAGASAGVAQTAAAPPPAEDKKVCKRTAEAETGSNLRRGSSRVCKKASEWKAEQDELQRELDNLRSSGNAPGASGSPAAGPDPSGGQ